MFDIYGILATESVDRTGETLSIQGADISDLLYLNDEHQSAMFSTLGSVKLAKKIFSERECEDGFQLKCWKLVKKPFIYIHARLASPDHPNAAAAEGLVKYSYQNPEFPIGFSVEGATLERQGKLLAKTKIIAASLTVKPCNTECLAFPMMDLTKSVQDPVSLPEKYKNSTGARKAFYNVPTDEQRLLSKSMLVKETLYLMKSGEALESATVLKCWNCGEGKLFMRNRPPNRCVACGEPFNLIDIYRATTSKGVL